IQASGSHSQSDSRAHGPCFSERGRMLASTSASLFSDDPDVLRLAIDGLQAFETRTAQRILAEHSDQVAFNNCPQCGAIARPPKARQCRFCGFDWHRTSLE